jgi:hypothetical protein
VTRLAWLGRERDNLRGALAWAIATEEAEIAARQWWAPEEGERVSYEPTRGWKGDQAENARRVGSLAPYWALFLGLVQWSAWKVCQRWKTRKATRRSIGEDADQLPATCLPEGGGREAVGYAAKSVPDFVDLVPYFSVMTLGRGPEGDTKAVLMLGDLPRPYLAHDPQSCSSQRADCAEGCPEAGAFYRRPKRPVSVMPGWPSSG